MTSYTPDVAVGAPGSANDSFAARTGAWLTVERVAYAGLTLLALTLRLIGLGRAPLGPDEAQQALRALNAARALPFDMVGAEPALFAAQRLLFTLFGASEFAVRFWPAVFGGFSVLCFLAFRQRLGRGGALMAATLWAISPIAVFSSRLGYGDALVPSLALAVAAALEMAWLSANERDPSEFRVVTQRYTALTGAALGLMLASGGNAYTVLAMALLPALVWRSAARGLWRALRPNWKAGVLSAGAMFALSATFVFTTPDGLAAAAALPGVWAHDALPWVGEYTAFELVGRLAMSEIVVLVLGLIGLGFAVRKRDAFGMAAGLAAGVALFVVIAGRGRHPLDLALVILPLAILGGPVGGRVFENFTRWCFSLDSVLLAVVNLVLLLTTILCLAGAFNPVNPPSSRQAYLIIGSITLILAVLQWFAYGAVGDWQTVGRVAPFAPLLLGLSWMLSQSIGISVDHGAWRQANLLHLKTGAGYADLADELRNVAAQQGRGDREVSVDLVLAPGRDKPLEPVLMWLLRDYPMVQRSAAIPFNPAPVVITAAEIQPALAEGYSGADFSVLERWQPAMLDSAYARLRWVLYREARIAPETTGAVLWVRRPPAPASNDFVEMLPDAPAEPGAAP